MQQQSTLIHGDWQNNCQGPTWALQRKEMWHKSNKCLSLCPFPENEAKCSRQFGKTGRI